MLSLEPRRSLDRHSVATFPEAQVLSATASYATIYARRGRGVLVAYEVAQKGGTGGNGRADPGNGKPDSPDLADRVKAWAGLLLAAFLAAVNLIGLNNGEIPNILRNNIVAADVTGLLIVAAAVTAVIGALLPASRHLPVLWLAPIALAVAAVVLLPEVFIQIPTTGDYSENFAFWSGGLGIAAFITLVVVAYRYGLKHRHSALRLAPGVLAAGALACFAAFLYQAFAKSYLTDYWIWSVIFLAAALIAAGIYRYRDHLGSSPESDAASSSGGPGGAGAATTTDDRPKADPPAPGDRPAARPGERAGSPRSVFSVDGRSVLLVVAVALTAVATFAALRAETRSQDQSAAPKLDSTLTLAKPGADGTYDLTVKASATHLPGSNIVEITVYGLPYPGSHSPETSR